MTSESRNPILPPIYAVISSFILIVAFSTVDLAISPLAELFRINFQVPIEKVLWLISSCTFGIVLGVFAGPVFTRSFRVPGIVAACTPVMLISLALFLLIPNFYGALLVRFFFGLAVGVLSTVMWWITFHGIGKEYFQSMLTVLVGSRPLAVAVGVPSAGMIALYFGGWKTAFLVLLILIVAAGIMLILSFPKDEEEKKPLALSSFFKEYHTALSLPGAKLYYLSLTINKVCYFGFYSMTGIWFIRIYHLTPFNISSLLVFIGLAEATIAFAVPMVFRAFGQDRMFYLSLFLSIPVFALLFRGEFILPVSVFLFALFVVLDRIYSMALIASIPQMFKDCPNKTIMGSLMTLSAWSSLMAISWFQGEFLDAIGLKTTGLILWGCLIIGSLLLYFACRKQNRKEAGTETAAA
jgi:predicted MFS family arabinose efflux permease